jgi:hypothetical protein
MADLMILTASELKAVNPLERQAARRAAREQPLVQRIFQAFLERGGPIPVEDLVRTASGSVEAAHAALITLDDEDLILIRAGQVDLAYPFSAVPTPFQVRVGHRGVRYACCAMDALGMAPMTGEAIEIRSRCHHCGTALEFSATPHGPGRDADGLMVWFGERGDERCKVADSL